MVSLEVVISVNNGNCSTPCDTLGGGPSSKQLLRSPDETILLQGQTWRTIYANFFNAIADRITSVPLVYGSCLYLSTRKCNSYQTTERQNSFTSSTFPVLCIVVMFSNKDINTLVDATHFLTKPLMTVLPFSSFHESASYFRFTNLSQAATYSTLLGLLLT